MVMPKTFKFVKWAAVLISLNGKTGRNVHLPVEWMPKELVFAFARIVTKLQSMVEGSLGGPRLLR